MRADRGQSWGTWGIAVLAAVAVAGGLMLAGGPFQARKERRDEVRAEDLRRLSAHIDCLSQDGIMPADLAETARCSGPIRRADPYSGVPYRVEALDRGSYRLCAGFELPEDPDGYSYSGRLRDGDCLIFDLPRLPALSGDSGGAAMQDKGRRPE